MVFHKMSYAEIPSLRSSQKPLSAQGCYVNPEQKIIHSHYPRNISEDKYKELPLRFKYKLFRQIAGDALPHEEDFISGSYKREHSPFVGCKVK